MDENNGVLGLIQRERNHGIAIWLGLFAMLMIHVGPLISGAQALIEMDAAVVHSASSLHERATPAIMHLPLASNTEHHQPSNMPLAETVHASEHAEHAVDYHALMGHQPAPAGTPQWLANLEMCGYCDLLTVSPPLLLALLLALPVVPPVQWLVVLPTPPRPLPAEHSLRHPRAPPIHLFT